MDTSLSPDSEHIREVYAHAGLALYLAQCYEMAVANFLVIYRRATNRSVSLEELFEVETKAEKSTLGRLLREVQVLCDFDEKSIGMLEGALASRNRLCHHFFKVNAAEFLSGRGREKMIDMLQAIQREMEVADTLIEAANRAMVSTLGVDEALIQAELEKLLRASGET